jgi:glycogen debranching enzyme
LAEVQGYAFDARRSMAELLRLTGDADGARSQDLQADLLREAFDEAFWMPQEGFYALALDGRKRQVDSIASNAGHCLWSGIALPQRAVSVVERLMSPEMFSGWGVRTLSPEMALYNPLSYHNGSIWPHDNSLIAAGMTRYGCHTEAATIASSIMDAACQFPDYQMPELFAGYPRRERSAPVPYPAANAPQAWSCGAVIYLLEALLGVEASADKLAVQPRTGALGAVHLKGVPFRGRRLDL